MTVAHSGEQKEGQIGGLIRPHMPRRRVAERHWTEGANMGRGMKCTFSENLSTTTSDGGRAVTKSREVSD